VAQLKDVPLEEPNTKRASMALVRQRNWCLLILAQERGHCDHLRRIPGRQDRLMAQGRQVPGPHGMVGAEVRRLQRGPTKAQQKYHDQKFFEQSQRVTALYQAGRRREAYDYGFSVWSKAGRTRYYNENPATGASFAPDTTTGGQIFLGIVGMSVGLTTVITLVILLIKFLYRL
jgi:hypothetical protein